MNIIEAAITFPQKHIGDVHLVDINVILGGLVAQRIKVVWGVSSDMPLQERKGDPRNWGVEAGAFVRV